jgi:hypothetical protein
MRVTFQTVFKKNQKGQTFLEFIFVLITMISIGMFFIRGINGLMGKRWETIIKIISDPNEDQVQMN